MDYRELWTDPTFLEMVAEYVAAHVAKWESSDFATAYVDPMKLAGEAHKIAGSAGMYGFADLGDSARSLETAIRESAPVEDVRSLFEDIKIRVMKARDEYESFASGQDG